MAAEIGQALAVAAPAPVPVEIWSLRVGLAQSLTLPNGALIRVRAVVVDQSSPLATVLHQQATERHWVVPDGVRVIRLANLDYLLNLGIHGFCKILREDPFNERYLNAFRNFTSLLLAVAVQVGPARLLGPPPLIVGQGGELFWSVTLLCRRCRDLVARGLDHSRSEEAMLAEVDKISSRMAALRAAIVLLDPPPDE